MRGGDATRGGGELGKAFFEQKVQEKWVLGQSIRLRGGQEGDDGVKRSPRGEKEDGPSDRCKLLIRFPVDDGEELLIN